MSVVMPAAVLQYTAVKVISLSIETDKYARSTSGPGQLYRNCAHHFLEHIYLYVSNVWWFLLILGTSRHWPHQLACLQWSFTTPHYHPRYPPSRSPHPTQATPSLCPLLLLLITEMTINLCYDAQKYVENHDNASEISKPCRAEVGNYFAWRVKLDFRSWWIGWPGGAWK